jgi:DNA-binding MarR family transcriptional regulator
VPIEDAGQAQHLLGPAGLVERRRHPSDRRKNTVALTDKGTKTLRAGERAVEEAERRFLAPLPAEAAHSLRAALRELISTGR